MKYTIIILLILFGLGAQAQLPTNTFRSRIFTGNTEAQWTILDSPLVNPILDTFYARYPGTQIIRIQGADTAFWFYAGNRIWKRLGNFDSTSLSNRINLKLNITDTVGKWLAQTSRLVDTIYRVNDSTVGYTIKGNARTFQILGRLPSGGGAGTVTSVALSMPAAFTVTGSPITTSGTFSVSGAGTALQYIRGDGTLATMDTTAIPNFFLKVRNELSGTSPINYNTTTGAISINNATSTGTKGAASFTSSFQDNGSGQIDLATLVSAGSCTGCTLNIDAKGRILSYADGPAGATNNVNLGSGFRILNATTQEMRTIFAGFGTKIDSVANANGLTWRADTIRVTGLPTYYYVDSSVNATSITANNGLTKTGNNIQLGGTLIKNTTVDNSSFIFTMTGTNSSEAVLVNNTGAGRAIEASSIDAPTFEGVSTNASVFSGISTNGIPISVTSTNNAAGQFSIIPSNTNSVITSLVLTRGSTGTATSGIGQRIDYYAQTSDGSSLLSNRLISKFTNNSTGFQSSQFIINGANIGSNIDLLTINGNGQHQLNQYTGTNFQTIDTSYNSLVVDGSGNVFKRAGGSGGGGSATLNNIGSGYRWVATSGGNIKTAFGSNTVIIDSSSNTNGLTFKADTSVLATQYALSLKPKVYNIVTYGAIADGKENYSASISSGSSTLTCTGCGFTSSDIGKWIRIYRAAASSQDLVTTITGFTNSTTVTINTNAGSTVSADTVIYGSDNVPAIQSALNAANANGGDAEVIIPPPGKGKFYVLGGTLDHSGGDCNCQIRIPVSGIRDTSFNGRKSIVIDGLMPPNHTPSALFADTTTPKENTTLVSIIHGSGKRPSVFASIDTSFLYANGINYNMVTIKNIALFVERNRMGGGPDVGGMNFYNMSSSPLENVVVGMNGPIHGTQQPTNEVAGIIVGQLSSEIYSSLKDVSVFGFKYGLVTTESVSLDHVITHACVNGITLIHGNYPVIGAYVDAHWCKNSLYIPQSTILGDITPGIVYFNIQYLGLEVFNGSSLGAPAWLNYTYIISDSANYGRGSIFGYSVGHAEVGIDNTMFNKFGGDSIYCYQAGSAVDRNPHIYAGFTEYAGWQNGGLTNYFYNWSPLNDVSIMRLSPVSAGSQALYLSPNSTGGSGGVPKSWINLFNTALWTGVNTTSADQELLQIGAKGTAGYNIQSSKAGTGTIRDINIGNDTYTSQLKIGSNGSTSLNSTSITDALVVNGSTSSRVSILLNNSNSAGSTSLYALNDRGSFNTYGGVLTGGSTNAGTLFGLTEADKTFLIHDGANGLGMGIGTLQSTPLTLGTNNVNRLKIAATGAITFNNAYTFPTSDGSANQVLQTNGSGAVSWATISGSTTIYNGDGRFPTNRIVSGANNNLTFDSIGNFKINANTYIFQKQNGTFPYTAAIIGSGNVWEIGYTPTPGTFSKGAGVIIDTNNNASLGTTLIPSTAPLYTTGGSTYVSGFQNQAGNFYRVDNVTSNTTATITQYYFTIDATGGNITITLPAASSAFAGSIGIHYVFDRIDNSINTVTVNANGGDSVNGAASFTLVGQYTPKQLQCISSTKWAQY